MGAYPRAVESFTVDQLSVEIHAKRDDLGVAAARAMADHVRALLERQPRVRLVFASAPSQNEFLAELSALPGIDWERVTAFHMDEYVGLASDASQSFAHFLREHLFDRVNPGVFHALNGLAEVETECRRYAGLIGEAPVDIVCAGIGENGHLAFNDPPYADFDDPLTVKPVQLAQRSREQQVHDGCFPDLDSVPRLAITLTIPALLSAERVYCMVPGPTKAEAVRSTLLGPIVEGCPATIMRKHPGANLYVDADSAALFTAERRKGT